MDQIVCDERSKRKSQPEKEEMCFVYLVVVFLREQNFLDNHNRPNPAIRAEIRRTCMLTADWSIPIAIKNSVFQS